MKVCKQGETGGETTVWLVVLEGRLLRSTLSPYEESRVRLALSSPQAIRAGPAAKTAIRRCAHTQEHVSLGRLCLSLLATGSRSESSTNRLPAGPSRTSRSQRRRAPPATQSAFLQGHNFTRSVPAPFLFSLLVALEFSLREDRCPVFWGREGVWLASPHPLALSRWARRHEMACLFRPKRPRLVVYRPFAGTISLSAVGQSSRLFAEPDRAGRGGEGNHRVKS